VRAGDSGIQNRYVAHFSHHREAAQPGFYRVQLNPEEASIGVSLASALRSGVGRIRFPRGKQASVLINAGASASGNSSVAVHVDPGQREITGSVTSGGFCGHANAYTLHFVVRFDRGFHSFGTWYRGTLDRGSLESTDSMDPEAVFTAERGKGRQGPTAQSGAFASFGRGGARVEARVGISFVSVENARQNLESEVASQSLGAVRRAGEGTWNEALSRIELGGGKRSDRRRFYSALYHSLIHPSTFSDVNGQYMGMDGAVHTAEGFTKYADFSGWDVYRTQIPLLAMLFPDRASGFVQSLIADRRESGWLPRWSVANGHTGISPGDPADPAIASAYAFGAQGFDQAAALEAMVHGATQYGKSLNAGFVERPGVLDYLALGYVPHELNAPSSRASAESGYQLVYGSATSTLEYALADFAIARFAAGRCDSGTYATFAQRSANWRRVLNPATGYVQPRFSGGDFAPVPPTSQEGFAEGNSAQYSWFVPQDVAGLVEAIGGPVEATARLDRFFSQINGGPNREGAYLGNEPTLGTPWLYGWLARPYRTQEIVRRAILRLYKDDPGGFPGNDDFGTMSAWYVFAALGLYPAIPGTDVLVIGSPLFQKAVLRLPAGDVTIEAPSAARKRPYVHGLTLNGVPHDRPWLTFAELTGGQLHFSLDRNPDQAWGSNPADAPPSFPPSEPLPASCG